MARMGRSPGATKLLAAWSTQRHNPTITSAISNALTADPHSMLLHQALRGQRPPYRQRSRSPRQYTDLSHADLRALADILACRPTTNTSADAASSHETKQLIADLPSHLRCSVPCLSPLCTAHKRLNPLPLVSLWRRITWQVDHELCTLWVPLLTETGMSAPHAHIITLLRLHAWHERARTCAACELSRLAADDEPLIALGAITLATLSPHNWHRSKRVYFFERQLQATNLHTVGTEDLRRMFELGGELHRVRERLRAQRRRLMTDDRPHVGDAVRAMHHRGAASPVTPPSRPPRSPEQDDHLAVAASLSSKGGRLDEVAACMGQSAPALPRKPVVLAGPKPAVFAHAPRSGDEEKAAVDGSSVYSCPEDNTEEPLRWSGTTASSPPPETRAADRIKLCGPTALPLRGESVVSEHDTSRKPPSAPARRRQSRLAHYTRPRLTPIAIPRRNVMGTPDLLTSGLWARRFDASINACPVW
ncbi:hypothetical protein LTR53_000384 [Teratosphaeriaceae sp. CCFEE 6253]|nr:hypothetical protein LTR53_000384 [Teratosphaeriaceae sp. CCFEE 6253]